MSAGGEVYHTTARCGAYLFGRRQATARFDNVHPIEAVSKLQALAHGRRACDVCAFTAMIKQPRSA